MYRPDCGNGSPNGFMGGHSGLVVYGNPSRYIHPVTASGTGVLLVRVNH
jgi:hypothetical protein